MHWFEYKIKDPDRTTTKTQWKKISRWMRICRNTVESMIDKDKLAKAITDAMLYGSYTYPPVDVGSIYGKSPING